MECEGVEYSQSKTSVGFSYLEVLQGVGVGVTVQDDVVGHAEALPHSQVIEERRLSESVRHFHHSYICETTSQTY